jgi:phenylacetate-coenzyme A ligase PaaK-like adenylate-forming protein
MNIKDFKDRIFQIGSTNEFEALCMELFRFQAAHNAVYKRYIELLKIKPTEIAHSSQIPFMPISFFKDFEIRSCQDSVTHTFTSSGTSGMSFSQHLVADISIYEQSFMQAFEAFYGPIQDYCVLALLPSYLERQGSSLIYMADKLIRLSEHKQSGFYLNEFDDLNTVLKSLEVQKQKTLLLGVSFGLLDFAEAYHPKLEHTIVMETGGMKGRRKEMIRTELHEALQKAFGLEQIHSEYGMTELLSQAYCRQDQTFDTPPWMKVLIRDTTDPLTLLPDEHTGGINIIDLANIESCAFIATQDLGKKTKNDRFEVLGRFDNSDIRGCNLLIQ